MKQSYNIIITLVMLFLFVSCSKALEDDNSIYQENRQITFTATQETNTKTSVDDNTGKVYWSPNEKIKVFFESTPAEFVSLNTEKTLTATFSGMLPIIIGSSEGLPASTNVMGLYPYDADATCKDGIITTTLNMEQPATVGSFANGAFPTISRTTATNYNLMFYNICGGVKFSVKSKDDIKRVILKGNNNEKLAGNFKVRFNDNGVPEVLEVTDGFYRVILSSDASLKTGESYYIVSLPTVFTKGLTIRLETETEYAEKIITDAKQIKRSVWGVLTDIDESLVWKKKSDFVDPLTFTSHGKTNLCLRSCGNPDEISLQFKINNGEYQDYDLDWISLADGETISLQAKYENKSFSKSFSDYYTFIIIPENEEEGATVSVSGNIMSLLSHSEPSETIPAYCFSQLFSNCDILTDAHELQLPVTTLAENCYEFMFSYCTSLTQAPDLPATTLAESCYYSMFGGCISLTKAPVMSATSLAKKCCEYMFNECKSMIEAPELPATSLAEECYSVMFRQCTSLTKAPALPATNLAQKCYESMFLLCDKLETCPDLPATTLTECCYKSMFDECISLNKAPVLPATSLAKECYESMFRGCKSLIEVPELHATTLAEECYESMFKGCSKLTQAPVLSATMLASRCYFYMFNGCVNLTFAPDLPATTLAEECYNGMFKGCSKLTQAPVLPASKLVKMCYDEMFFDCTSLSYVKCLAKEPEDGCSSLCCSKWLENVSEVGKFVKAQDAEWFIGSNGIPGSWEIEEVNGQ